MAQNALDSIIKDAMLLKQKLGSEEKDIPAWIQDHITNATSYLSQAADNYHEYSGLQEGVIQNANSPQFDGGDPTKIQVHNAGVGGVNSLQGHRDQIVRILEEMLKSAQAAQKDHNVAHFSINRVINLADPRRASGVLMTYLENHQKAVEELEAMRRKGGAGAGRTVPKGLI